MKSSEISDMRVNNIFQQEEEKIIKESGSVWAEIPPCGIENLQQFYFIVKFSEIFCNVPWLIFLSFRK